MKTLTIFFTLIFALLIVGCETPSLPGLTVAANATKWEGSYYRRGVSAQCANWVGTVVRESGHSTPANPAKSTNWLSWGKPVPISMIRPGDVVIYARGSNGYHHAAIYRGAGKVTHRPTRNSQVKTMDLHYRRIIGVRRASHAGRLS